MYLTRLPRWCSGEESACQYRRPKRCRFNPWVRKIPGSRKWQPTLVFGNLLQYFCQENSMDRGVWWATVHKVAKSHTWLSYWMCVCVGTHTHTHTHTHTQIYLTKNLNFDFTVLKKSCNIVNWLLNFNTHYHFAHAVLLLSVCPAFNAYLLRTFWMPDHCVL